MKRNDITTCLENGIENFEDGEQFCNPPSDDWMDKGVKLVKHDGFLTVSFAEQALKSLEGMLEAYGDGETLETF